MQATTLTVPAEHREAFRRAALYEVGFSGEMVTTECKSLAKKDDPPQYDGGPLTQLEEHAAMFGADLRLLAQVGFEDGPVEVQAELETLLGTAETMARATGKQLAEGLNTAPVEPGDVKATRDSLDWALAQVERLGERWSAEKEAVPA